MKALLEIFFKWLWPDFWSCHCYSVPWVIIMYTEWDQWKTERGSNGPGGEAATEANNVVLTHWWGRDWGLHQASSHWDHETTMAPLGRPALPTRPYPNICGTAQYLAFCLGHYAICLDCFTNCLGCSAPTNGKILAICCFASGPSSTLSDILNPFKAISLTWSRSGH